MHKDQAADGGFLSHQEPKLLLLLPAAAASKCYFKSFTGYSMICFIPSFINVKAYSSAY